MGIANQLVGLVNMIKMLTYEACNDVDASENKYFKSWLTVSVYKVINHA